MVDQPRHTNSQLTRSLQYQTHVFYSIHVLYKSKLHMLTQRRSSWAGPHIILRIGQWTTAVCEAVCGPPQ